MGTESVVIMMDGPLGGMSMPVSHRPSRCGDKPELHNTYRHIGVLL
jgi:hypothetical protein